MANVVITNGATSITAVFNSTNGELEQSCRNAVTLHKVELRGVGSRKGPYVEALFADGSNWTFDVEGTRGLAVDSVGGVATTTNVALVASLTALMKN